ncbi:MAG: hypothetical protein JSS86_13605 [Cyanobacteria bacterium SZAS LIN-2]|nr:hypothetical protein [Cyanobacteria bacterium SZAS LIN-3]MBS1997349.1 hypothetical protein [Cyanobacteria bacterium SZAS LIN-2]MBS2010342.1 hypothetical protein [Cyanobacteria bacterium SZAS TMP-1]
MADDISKLCSDFLRKRHPGLKASHARELVAAFFGYKSHAALLADSSNPVDDLIDAAVIIPDVGMISERSGCLTDLPRELFASYNVQDEILECLQINDCIDGEVWESCGDVGQYLIDEYLPEHLSPNLADELADVTDPINAIFEDIEYEEAEVEEGKHWLTVTVKGTYSGFTLDAENFNGDTIDMEITVELNRVASRIGFGEPEIIVTGEVSRANFDLYQSEEQSVSS